MIIVFSDPATGTRGELVRDWVMQCEVHRESVTCATWQDAYEAALGHACYQHTKADVCERRGHQWSSPLGLFATFHGFESSPLRCLRCGEPAYYIEEVS